MDEREIWALEKRLWLEGLAVYNDVLDPACLMVFPGMGVMKVPAVLDSLRRAPRWRSVDMTDCSMGRATDTVIVLGYTAEGRREGADLYRCFCTSTYRADRDRWKLVQHQQTVSG